MSDERPDGDLRSLWDGLGPDDAVRVTPPPGLWDAIAAEVGTSPADNESPAAPERATAPAPVIDLDARRGRTRRLTAVAAAVVGVGAIGAGQLTAGSGATEVAAAVITSDGLPLSVDGDASAVVLDDDGRYVLELSVPAMPAADDGAWEVWVIDTAVADMHSLGTLDDDGRLALPAGVDPADFPIVDISFEPADGDPTHSGQSILRGRLEF
ncbi:MAG: anti-sigma factor [Acidimicrobiales bacterium]